MLKGAIAGMFLAIIMSVHSIGLGIVTDETYTSEVLDAAAIQMTLAAIAYVDDSSSLEQISVAIKEELAKTKYATKGQWQLAWGPALRGGNLVYIGRHQGSPQRYSVVVRGTDFALLEDDIEDVWVNQTSYLYADNVSGYPKVSRGALIGLHHIQQMTDILTGQSIEEFLKGAATKAELELVVTGHSLGGGLASLVLLWLHDTIPEWGKPIKNVHLSGYTFAGHTVGNADFADYFNSSVGTSFYRFVNPLDIVPRSYGDLSSILADDVPDEVPLKYRLVLDALRATLFAHGVRFQQVDTEILLDNVKLSSSTPYLTHVLEQHRPNSYLYLLGAPQVDVGHASALPRHDD